jgi:hypothetical protein
VFSESLLERLFLRSMGFYVFIAEKIVMSCITSKVGPHPQLIASGWTMSYLYATIATLIFTISMGEEITLSPSF